MADERPRPKYGELAPEGWNWRPPAAPADADGVAPADADGSAAGSPTATNGRASSPVPGQSNAGAPSRYGMPGPRAPGDPAERLSNQNSARSPGAGAESRPARPVDVAVTSVLLLLGILVSGSMIPALFDFNTVLGQAAALQGFGSFVPSDTASSAGFAAGVATIVLQLMSIVISVQRLTKRRLAFPVPLAIGVVTFVVWMVAISFAFFSDPSFVEHLMTTSAP